jgi:hypothetical protein
VAGSSESHADSSGTFTYTGTVEGSSESHADSSGTLKYTGTVEGSTESYADASGTVGATVLAAEDDRFHFIVPESWTVPHPVFFAGGDFGWANLEQNDLYRPPMPWPLPQPRYVQAPDETPELSESVTPDTPAGGMNAKALPVPSGQNLWFRFTDDGNDLATSTTVTGTVEASSESYAEASGTFRITGTAEASAESYADASGALRITGTAEANTESYAGASGALRITGTVEGSTESYAEATGTVSTAVVAEEDRNTPLTLWPVVQPNRVWFPDDVPQFSTTITGTVEASSEAYADALAGLTYTGTVEASTESHVFSAGTVTTPRGTEAGGGILDLDRKKKKKKRVQVAQTPEELGVVLGRLSPDARKRYEEMAATPGFDPMLIVAFLAMEFVDE